jgi:hypothetical protein
MSNIEGTSMLLPIFPKKRRLGPQNNFKSFKTRKTAKNSKLPKLPENCFEPVGKGGWPPISTWIIYNLTPVHKTFKPFITLFTPRHIPALPNAHSLCFYYRQLNIQVRSLALISKKGIQVAFHT